MFRPFGQGAVPFKGPYVYFIVLDRFLYIGETQKIPVVRWSQHLTANGTFRNKIFTHDPEVWHDYQELQFESYLCERIYEDVDSSIHRRATQWLEYQLHLLVNREPGLIDFEVVSDVRRTAPDQPTDPWLDDLAAAIFKDVLPKLGNNAVHTS